jgi:hypothetical protein
MVNELHGQSDGGTHVAGGRGDGRVALGLAHALGAGANAVDTEVLECCVRVDTGGSDDKSGED